MALFRRLFYRKPPDRLLEISERVYVFDCCFSTKILEEDRYREYMGGIVAQLQDYFPEASFMVFNFREGDRRSQVSDILSDYNMTVMDYPQQYEGCPLLPLEMIHHFLRSSESWLSMEGQHNVLLMHCERGGWPVLAFMLAGLLLYRQHHTGEQKTLEMVYKQAPKELLHLLSPLNPQPSHMRYLQYISRRGSGSDWPPQDTPFTLDCLILRVIPIFDREGGCRPMVHIYGQNPLTPANRSPKTLYATPMTKKYLRHYKQAEGMPIKINCRCRVQGDVVVECIHMDGDLEREEMMFRVMFNTAFVQSNILMLNRDEIDVAWNAKDKFTKDFKAEVLFSDYDAVESDSTTEVIADDEDETEGASTEATEEFFEAEEIFNNADWQDGKRDLDSHTIRIKSSVGDGSHKTDFYYFFDEARSRLETGNIEEDLKTIVTENLTTMDDKIANLETPSMAGPAESRLETGKAKYDDGSVIEKSLFLDNMTVIEEKSMLESSYMLQDTEAIDFSVGEEKSTLKIGNSKDTESIITFVRTTVDDSSWKLEAPTVVDEGSGRSEKRVTKPCVDDIITEKQSALNDKSPISMTFNMADEMRHNSETHDRKRDILSDAIQDEAKLCHEGRLGNLGMAEQTETRLDRRNASCGDKIHSRKPISLDYRIRFEEKNMVEVSNFKHEVKDIVTLAVEEKRPSGSFNFEEDADGIVTKQAITLDNMSCNSDDSTLADEANIRVEQRESRHNQENLIVRKKSALTQKNHRSGTPDIENETNYILETHVCKRDTDKGVTEKSLALKVLDQKTGNDLQKQSTEKSLPPMSKKSPTSMQPPDLVASRQKIKQQEHLDHTKLKTIPRYISLKDSDAATVHMPSDPGSRYNRAPGALAISANPKNNEAAETAESPPISASIDRIATSLVPSVQSALPPVLFSNQEVPDSSSAASLSQSSSRYHPLPPPSQLQAAPPPTSLLPPPSLGTSSNSFSAHASCTPSSPPPPPLRTGAIPQASPCPPPPPPPPPPSISPPFGSSYTLRHLSSPSRIGVTFSSPSPPPPPSPPPFVCNALASNIPHPPSPPPPFHSGSSTKCPLRTPPSPPPCIISSSFSKSSPPPPPPPPPPMPSRACTRGPPPPPPPVLPGASTKISPPPPPPPMLLRASTRGLASPFLPPPPPPPPPLMTSSSCSPPPPPPLLQNQGGQFKGPPPAPPPLIQPNASGSVVPPPPPHPQKIGASPPQLPPSPLLSSNRTKLAGAAAPTRAPQPLPMHGGPPPPPPPPRARRTPPLPPPLGGCGAPPPPPSPRGRGGASGQPTPLGACTPSPPVPPRTLGSPPPPPTDAPGSQCSDKGLSSNSLVGARGRGLARPAGSGFSALAPRRSSLKPLHWVKVTRAVQGSLWADLQKYNDAPSASEFDVSELESLFSAVVPKSDYSSKSEGRRKSLGSKSDKIHLIELRRANNTEIMLTKVKMPLSDLMSAVLALDDSILDVDQVENLIKFCPTKEEMELLRGYASDKEKLGKCEQFFLELMKVPRVESKLRVFSFKIQFGSQVSDLRKSLNTVDSACEQMRSSVKLKEIMKKILFLGNTLNQGTARGSAIGFRLDSLLKLIDTRATNNKMTLMHYLCKVLAARSPHLLDFHGDLTSLEAASKIQVKSLAEEMQAIIKGLEKVELELNASENDGPVSEAFRKTLKEFTSVAGAEARSLTALYAAVGRNADALALYFGEDPARCPFEQVISTLVNFVSMFRRAHQENCKQAELEKKKAQKEAEVEKSKASSKSENDLKLTRLSQQLQQTTEKKRTTNRRGKDVS